LTGVDDGVEKGCVLGLPKSVVVEVAALFWVSRALLCE
jgi:hypothetical protein